MADNREYAVSDSGKPVFKEIIIVEGKYDKIKLDSIVDALIIELSGFRIFNDKQKIKLIKTLASKRGAIIFTDNDRAGFVLRSFVKNIVAGSIIYNAYTPDVFGKEKRKNVPSKEGKIGVEGQEKEAIIAALLSCGVGKEAEGTNKQAEKISKADLYEIGLLGREESAEKRMEVMKKLDLPARLSANAFLEVVNVLDLDIDKLAKLI